MKKSRKPSNIQLLTIISILAILLLSVIQYNLTSTTYKYKDRELKKEIQRAVDKITEHHAIFDTVGRVTLRGLHRTIRQYAEAKDSLGQALKKANASQQSLIKEQMDGLKHRFQDSLGLVNDEQLNIYLHQQINEELRKKGFKHEVQYANLITEINVGINTMVVDSLYKRHSANGGILLSGEVFDYENSIPVSSGYITSKDYDVQLDSLIEDEARADTTGYFIAFRTLEFVDVIGWKQLLLQRTWRTFAAAIGSILFVVILFFFAIRTLYQQKRLNEIKTDFINNMTHELQTPIATLGIATKTLQQDAILQQPQTIKDIAQTIERQHLRLNKMINQVVHQSVSSSGIVLNKQSQNIQKFLETTLHDFKMKHLNHPIQLVSNLNTQTINIEMDTFHMRTAINNILENAYKYNSEGVTISVNSYRKKDKMFIELKDDGVGIPLSQQHLIFEKFYRIPTGNIHDVKGLGLGLHLTKQVIKAHHGSIELQKNNSGASFLITLTINDHNS